MTSPNWKPHPPLPEPTDLLRRITAYWESAALFAAHRLGLFHALAEAQGTAEDLASRLSLDARGTRMLLDACCAMGLAERNGEIYTASPLALAYLSPAGPAYLGAGMEWAEEQWEAWANLAEAVRTGAPVADPYNHLGGDAAETQRFVLAMHARALGVARGVVPFLGLDGCLAVLDVGAGSGAYAGLLAERNPAARVVALDLPGIVVHTREILAEAGLADRVECVAGDAEAGDYGLEEYDGVLFCGVLHQMAPDSAARMLRAAHRAMKPGGRVAVCDVMREAEGTSPEFATLFSLQMLLVSRAGGVFTVAECTQWLVEAGFADVGSTRLPPPLPYTVVTATRTR